MGLVASRSEQHERVTVPKTPSTNHELPQFPRDLSWLMVFGGLSELLFLQISHP
jgi:hypothetical protein